ncbi:MAG: helix-turn-helix domain-containing protein [Caulobacter sp.]
MTEKTRRSPRQARAASTVDAIVDATFQLLEERGFEVLTTNHIAARAGVSIGTLYQYFADKNDVLAAMAQRRAEAVRESIAAMLIEQPNLGSVRPIVRALMNGFEGSPATRHALLGALFSKGEAVLVRHHELFLAAIAGKAQLDITLTPERAFILTHAAVSLLRASAAEEDLALDPVALEDELVRLMEAYLAALRGA